MTSYSPWISGRESGSSWYGLWVMVSQHCMPIAIIVINIIVILSSIVIVRGPDGAPPTSPILAKTMPSFLAQHGDGHVSEPPAADDDSRTSLTRLAASATDRQTDTPSANQPASGRQECHVEVPNQRVPDVV